MHANGATTDPVGGPEEVGEWLAQVGKPASRIEPLAGDVSSRSYFRVAFPGLESTCIVARYPVEIRATQQRFSAAAGLLRAQRIRVPALLVEDLQAGFALLEDLGPATLYETAGSWCELPRELEAALQVIREVGKLDPERVMALGSPPLDGALLRRELEQTERLLRQLQGFGSPELSRGLDRLCELLAAAVPIPCHRDFMARNLVSDGRGGVGVLDFQDLRMGPPAYDLASLLNDSLFADRELEKVTVAQFGELGPLSYERSVVQRSLKAVGTFLSFAARGNRRHLGLVEPTLERALRFFRRLPELGADECLATHLRSAVRAAALC